MAAQGTLDTTKFKPPCVQTIPLLPNEDESPDSKPAEPDFADSGVGVVEDPDKTQAAPTEDCLYLNVWTPKMIDLRKESGTLLRPHLGATPTTLQGASHMFTNHIC